MCLLLLLAVHAVQAEVVTPARVRGQIKDFAGGNVLMYYSEKVDTLQVDKNGVFDYSVIIDNPTVAYLIFEDYKCEISLFIENGMNAKLTVSFVQEPDGYKSQFVYEGSNEDCTEFMNAYHDWSLFKSPWPFSHQCGA